MKKLPFLAKLIFLAGVFFTSCNNVTISTGDGSNKVEANGKIKSEVRDLTSFNAIEVDGVFNIILSQSDKESIKVETDENILPLIITLVENGVLKIKMKDNTSVEKMKKIDIYVTLAEISKLNTNGVGSLKCANKLRLKEFELDSKGVGSTELNLNAEKLIIHSEIVGALKLSGIVKDVIINHSGIGLISAFDLKAENLNLNSEGAGAAEVYASNELSIDVNGIGSVKYKGNPKTKNIKKEGIGKVESVE